MLCVVRVVVSLLQCSRNAWQLRHGQKGHGKENSHSETHHVAHADNDKKYNNRHRKWAHMCLRILAQGRKSSFHGSTGERLSFSAEKSDVRCQLVFIQPCSGTPFESSLTRHETSLLAPE